MDRFIEFRSKENIRPVTIPNKEKYYYDLENVENSWSGRADVWSIGNTFVMEAEQLLINSLELFEMGYCFLRQYTHIALKLSFQDRQEWMFKKETIVSFQAVLKVFPHIVLNVIPSRVFVVIVYILLDDICPICVIGIFRKFHYKNSSIIYLAAE